MWVLGNPRVKFFFGGRGGDFFESPFICLGDFFGERPFLFGRGFFVKQIVFEVPGRRGQFCLKEGRM